MAETRLPQHGSTTLLRLARLSLPGLFLLMLLAAIIMSCSVKPVLKPFTSDGCSLFPDQSFDGSISWCECCFRHDLAYWQGGTQAERQAADLALQECVVAKGGDAQLADLMYKGVRWGGSPYFPNWYRWGYGWPYSRSYAPLSMTEQEQVDRQLQAYHAANPVPLCGTLARSKR